MVVIMAEREKEDMEQEIARMEFDFKGTSTICRYQGRAQGLGFWHSKAPRHADFQQRRRGRTQGRRQQG